ncbi:nucleoside phosphorylase [Magnetospirillum sp. SS-4]|uniref:phosphorylase family protein n=1 Tax=Magnetospirillum sp. SS-4 TaxID=2681465 RepID=UPI00137CD4DE|nr:nucleoside phosphorylase [Magnetospirillum sp. SS-4]CAA7620137.1 Nucleoside phosphorylase [Magnetospirillum sp. SS-4]
MRIGIVVGMKSEAALLPPGSRVACAGGIPARAEALARRMADEGAEALASIGIAGGLDPSLSPGAVIVAAGVETADAVFETDAAWTGRLLALLPQARHGLVAGADTVAASPADKAALFGRRGALAVDMESGAVAKVAAERRLPFAVIRSVADPYDRSLPPSAMAGLDEDGSTRLLAVMAGLLRRPGDLGGLIRVGLDSGKALSALRDALKIVGPPLGFQPGQVLR